MSAEAVSEAVAGGLGSGSGGREGGVCAAFLSGRSGEALCNRTTRTGSLNGVFAGMAIGVAAPDLSAGPTRSSPEYSAVVMQPETVRAARAGTHENHCANVVI